MSATPTLSQAVAESWLALQCQIIPGTRRAALFSGEETDSDYPVAIACWPQGVEESDGLRVAAARALSQNRPVVGCDKRPTGETASLSLNIACPVLVEGQTYGVIAVELENSDEQRQRAVLQMLQWGSLWLQFVLQRDESSSDVPIRVLGIVAGALEPTAFRAAATTTATALASTLQCERVSIGILEGERVALKALSNSANFDRRANLVRDLEQAMAEALDQQSALQYPADKAGRNHVLTAHATLCEQHRSGSILSLPLASGDKLVGAITFERAHNQVIDRETREQCEVLASLLGPILELKRQGERSLAGQARDSARKILGSLFGPGHIGAKSLACSAGAVLLALSLLNGEYRATGTAVLEGSIQRVVVTPMDGFIKSASVRPGDIVKAGQVLGALDDQELRLELLRWSGQRAQLQKEYREALGNRERTRVGILSAEIAQADAQMQLLEAQLSRTEFVAPYDGVVVSGDLSQEFGAPVERGRVLFTVAPLNSYRVVVQVEEQEVFDIAPGQRGQLVLAARPNETLELTVESITPVSTARDGHNYFRVEAGLDAPTNELRPGMQGVAKISIDQRKLIWIWTHRLIDWLRLWSWSWLA
jgi:RND family efflux transporter MFP subunit